MESLVQIGLSNAVVALALAAIAAVVGALARKPALTHCLWLLVLLKLVTPPLVHIPIGWSEPAPAAPADAFAVALPEEDEAGPEVRWGHGEVIDWPAEEAAPFAVAVLPPAAPAAPAAPAWWHLLGWVWLAGTLLWFAVALARVVAFQRLLRFARPAPEWLCRQVAALGAKLRLTRMPPILLVPGRLPPMLWTGLFGPRLLLPADLWDGLSAQQRETLLVHELAHLRRRDHWVRGLEMLVLGLYWWHPLVWIAARQLREAEEQCCDAWVVTTLSGSGRTYAEAILQTLDFLAEARTPAPLLASGVGPVSDLKRRLTMIMRGTTPRALTWRGLIAVLALAVLLPAVPAWGQQPADKDAAAALKELREKLAELEKKLGGPRAVEPPAKVDPEALKKAEVELKEAQAALEKKMAEVGELSRKVAAAQEKVAKAGGKVERRMMIRLALPGEGNAGAFRVEPLAGGKPDVLILRKVEGAPGVVDHIIQIPRVPSVPGVPGVRGVPGVPAPPAQPGQRFEFELVRPGQPAQPGVKVVGPPADRRIENVEQKLERVLQELQELRRSMGKPGGPGPMGPGPGRPGPMGPGTGTGIRLELSDIEVEALRSLVVPAPAPEAGKNLQRR